MINQNETPRTRLRESIIALSHDHTTDAPVDNELLDEILDVCVERGRAEELQLALGLPQSSVK